MVWTSVDNSSVALTWTSRAKQPRTAVLDASSTMPGPIEGRLSAESIVVLLLSHLFVALIADLELAVLGERSAPFLGTSGSGRCSRTNLGSDLGRPHLSLMCNAFDVIIVGGGAAGIAAARRLAAHSKETLLLEASSRLGGVPSPRTSAATRSTSAANGSTRATATPGSASPMRPASRSTEASRHGRKRIPASPRTRTLRRRHRGRTVTGRSGSAAPQRAATGRAMPLRPAALGTPTCGP